MNNTEFIGREFKSVTLRMRSKPLLLLSDRNKGCYLSASLRIVFALDALCGICCQAKPPAAASAIRASRGSYDFVSTLIPP